MIHIILLPGAALLAAGIASVQGPGPRPDPNADITRAQVIERVDQRFARLDANNDGRFTREEGQSRRAQRRQEMANRMFDRVDADRNGSITREEMSQARATREARRGERSAAGGPPRRGPGMRGPRGPRGTGMRGMRMFGEQGFVTRDQLRQHALERFDRADADRNGTLTPAERRAARPHRGMRMRHGPGGPGGPEGPPPPPGPEGDDE
jgi:hypothetical protein